MATMINVNGTLTTGDQAMVPALDHGFLYGEGVYEVCRTYNGRLFLYDRHMRRLRKSAERIALDVPFSDEEIGRRSVATIAAAGLGTPATPGPDAYVRIVLTRGAGELSYDPAACGQPSLVIIAKEHVAPARDVYDLGVRVSLAPVARNHPNALNPLIKSNNLLNNALAMQHALRHGAFEAVMRNLRGEISECSQSNLFIVRNGTVLTPPLEAGLLAGITRELVFEIAQSIGAPLFETTLLDRDLLEADEAFLTSTTREIVPIVLVDEHRIGTGHPGAVTRALLEAFRGRADALTRGSDAQTPAFSA